MPITFNYCRETCQANGKLLDEYCSVTESKQFVSPAFENFYEYEPVERHIYRLTNYLGQTLHEKKILIQVKTATTTVEVDTMPQGWSPPSPQVVEELSAAYKAAKWQTLARRPNAVTFLTYNRDGRIILDKRSYTNCYGAPLENPGKLNTTGGEQESLSPESEMRREFKKEFGIDLVLSDAVHLGEVYDPDAGRTNQVYRVITPLEVLQKRQFVNDIDGLIEAVNTRESLGHNGLFLEDLEAAIQAGDVTSISVAIFNRFNHLKPPSKINEDEIVKLEDADVAVL